MTPEEDAAWWALNALLHGAGAPTAVSPCHDCPRVFAEEMRAGSLCDGRYSGEFAGPVGALMRLANGRWAYSDSDRIAARRATWRMSSRRRRVAA